MTQNPLDDYLTPEQQAELAQSGHLDPEVRASRAKLLRRELCASAAYIPYRLLRTQLDNPQPGRIGGDFWEGSILFADLSGFTTFCEELSALGKQGAEEVSSVVNQLFNGLVAEVLSTPGELGGGGELLKFGGDALTAFFDAETFGEAHAIAATSAALRMQKRMEAFTSVETRAGIFRLGLRIGVHSGNVFAAEVGDESHIELVVLGAGVNRVALAQSIAAPGEVVISEQTAQMLEGAEVIPRKVAGFFQVLSLPETTVIPPAGVLHVDWRDDIAALERLATQIAALKPYLLRDLPRRYLDNTVTDIGELRPVSVIFANFYDFSALLPLFEDHTDLAANALNAYFRRVQTVVHRYGGVINKVDMYTRGDKIMALFGAPGAHEDDALRAVRCALELVNTLEEANTEIGEMLAELNVSPSDPLEQEHKLPPAILPQPALALKQRIGINTGTVFAGRVGGSHRYEYTVMGPAVNLASRLMESAEEGTVLISPATRASVERRVIAIEQAPIHIRGIAEPIVPWRVLDEEEEEPMSMTEGRSNRAPLVGRDPELVLLLAEAKVALRESGRMLALVGDAGVGKTRLTDELIRNLVMASVSQDQSEVVPHFQIYTGTGNNLTQSVPYITLRAPLQHILGFSMRRMRSRDEMEEEGMLLHLQHRVEQLAPEFSHFLPILGDILGIELPETALTKSLSIEQRYSRIQDLVVAILLGAAAHEPLVLVIDDLHWADASSIELLARLAKSIATAPMLLIVCYRPDASMNETWVNVPTTMRQELVELSPEHSTAMLEGILNGPPPPDIVNLIKRTQGNPFFIEELVHALVASGTLAKDEKETWHLTCPPEEVTVPTSIEGLIMARLDQLDEPFQELVQVASVIGHRFKLQVLEGVYRDSDLLHTGLQHLMAADIVVMEDQPREFTYLFRHALLHDIAYESILYSQRRELHRRVAQRIEELNTGHLDEHLALLARHYFLAEDWDVSFRFHLTAGVRAQNHYANQEALALYATALDIAPRLKRGMENGRSLSRDNQPDLFAILYPLFPTILQVAELYERTGYVYVRIGEYHRAHKPYMEALNLINQLNEEKERWNAEEKHFPIPNWQLSTTIVRLHRHIANLQEQLANYDMAFDWLERGMSLVMSESQGELARCYLVGSRLYYNQGEFDKCLEWAQQGRAVAESIGNTIDQAHASLLMGILWRDRGAFDLSIPALEQARTLLDLMKDASHLSDALRNLGDAYFCVGRWQDTAKCYQKSLQISENVGDVQGMAHASTSLANLMVRRGDLQIAEDLYQYSRSQFSRIGSLLGLAIINYHQGEVLLIQHEPRNALHHFRESMTSLERVKARNYLARVLHMAAEAALTLEDTEQALGYISRSQVIASELGMAVEEAVAYRVMGQIALQQQDYTCAAQYLEQSYEMLQKMGHRYEIGLVLYWQAQLYARTDKQVQVLSLLQEAEQIFKELRARRVLEMVRQAIEEHAATAVGDERGSKRDSG